MVCWTGKRSEEHLQSSNESIKIKQKRQKERNKNTEHMPEKNKGEGHSIERVWYIVPAASHPITSPDRNHASKRIASTTPYSQGFRFFYRHRRPRLGSPWVGPINAALKPTIIEFSIFHVSIMTSHIPFHILMMTEIFRHSYFEFDRRPDGTPIIHIISYILPVYSIHYQYTVYHKYLSRLSNNNLTDTDTSPIDHSGKERRIVIGPR